MDWNVTYGGMAWVGNDAPIYIENDEQTMVALTLPEGWTRDQEEANANLIAAAPALADALEAILEWGVVMEAGGPKTHALFEQAREALRQAGRG